jgi:hypothetical protein
MQNKRQLLGDLSCIRRIIRDFEMVDERFQNSSENDGLEQLLKKFVFDAQRHPHQSSQRQLALSQLMERIMKSEKLGHPQREKWPWSLYEDFYNEALSRTWLEVCQKVENYNPERGCVMAWVNCLLKYNFIRVIDDCEKSGITRIPRSGRSHITCLPSLDDLDHYIPPTESVTTDRQLIRQFLEEDPEGLLRAERLRERPDITFQFLALAKYVEDQTWDAIERDVRISTQTLCSFFNRRLQKLMPYFHKHL